MHKTKILLGLTLTIGMLAATATSSPAWFKAAPGAPALGIADPLEASVLTGGGGTVTCGINGTEAPEIHYKIAVKTGPTIFNQKEATEGPDQVIHVLKWGNECKAELGSIKASATVSPCLFHIQQQNKGELKALGSQLTACVIKASLCEIKIVPANEKTGENFNLGKIVLEQFEKEPKKDVRILGEIAGATGVGNGGLCPYTNNKTSEYKFKLLELEEELV
jgi:hypothetical protein